MQHVARMLAVGCALAVLAPLVGSVPAGAAVDDVCSLLTKKEASEILGAKVVKLERDVQDDNLGCTYKTKKFTSKHLKKFNGPLSLQVVWAPLTQDNRDLIDAAGSDFRPISGLGDEAYSTFGTVLAVQGDDIVQAMILNLKAPISKQVARSERAVRLALQRLPTG